MPYRNRRRQRATRRDALKLLGASAVTLIPVLIARRSQAQSLHSGALPSCIARPEQTEGPYFVDEALNRSDIRSDPRTGEVKAGVPLRLTFRVSRMGRMSCAPLVGARVDLWHSDATGRYSDARGFGFSTTGQQFLRGYQITDAEGKAQFMTIFPGWYGGRAVHVHFKIRAAQSSAPTPAFTSQLYFDDALTEHVFATEPYASRGRRWMRNDDDAIYRDGGNELLLTAEPVGSGYNASFDIGLQFDKV